MPPLRLWDLLDAMPRKKAARRMSKQGGSGFCRNELMSWCEQNLFDGLASLFVIHQHQLWLATT